MGVWQMIENEQPYLGQWDAVMDTNWDGCKWVTHDEYMDSLKKSVRISSLPINWSVDPFVTQNYYYATPPSAIPSGLVGSGKSQEPPANKADAAWSALESMF
jgi:hypothetical protein